MEKYKVQAVLPAWLADARAEAAERTALTGCLAGGGVALLGLLAHKAERTEQQNVLCMANRRPSNPVELQCHTGSKQARPCPCATQHQHGMQQQQQCVCRVSETEQRALKDITNANDERSRLSGEIEALRWQFKAYQGLKAVEVSRLEHRLRGCLQRLGPLGGRGEGAEARCARGVCVTRMA